MPGKRVCVIDERSEIAACHLGVPQNDLGPRTDVLDGCPKREGMRMVLRSMSPQVLAVDELGGEADYHMVEEAVYSGSRVLGTVHMGDIRELSDKPFLSCWMQKRCLQDLFLSHGKKTGHGITGFMMKTGREYAETGGE